MAANLLKKSSICFRTESKLAFLKDSIISSAVSSFSFILSLAQFLNSIKTITPPRFTNAPQAKKQDNCKSNSLQNQQPIDYYEIWCDYLFGVLCEGNVFMVAEVVILVDTVSLQFFETIQGLNFFEIKTLALQIQKKLTKNDIQAIFSKEQYKINQLIQCLCCSTLSKQCVNRPKKFKRIAIINFSSSVLCQDKFQPKIHIEGLISGILYNEGEKWRSYRILKNDIPTIDDLLKYDSIILSGSAHSVNNIPLEINKFKEILTKALIKSDKLKILGICFGHQLIANMEGSQIIKKPLNKGPQDIEFLLSNFQGGIPYLQQSMFDKSNQLRLYKFHCDHVSTVPRKFVSLATSDKCEIDALVSMDKRIFTMQFHPQFTSEYIQSYLNRCEGYSSNKAVQKKQLKPDTYHHESLQTFRKSLRRFLNWIN